VGADDDFGLTKSTGGLFSESEQNAAVALPLEIAADADEAKTCLLRADQIDAHRTHDIAVVYQHMRKMIGRKFVRVASVIGLARQQGSEDRVPANGVIGGPFSRRSHGPEGIALDAGDQLRVS
jgi:hypothetical protein